MIPIETSKLRFSAQSHQGLAGKGNQDRYALQAFQLKEGSSDEAVLAILADGLGGQRAGGTAAQLAVDVIYDMVAGSQGSQPSGILQAALLQAGQAILTQAEADRDKRGMGSTALCAWLIDRRLYSASVGDSRLYLLRGERLELLNVLSEVRGRGTGTLELEEEGGVSYLGARLQADVELGEAMEGWGSQAGRQLRANDRVLLCSGGLVAALDEERIAEILGQARIEDAAGNLVQAALDAGAQENLTALAIAVPPGRPMPACRELALRRRLRLLLASFLLVVISLLGWYFLGPQLDPSFIPPPTAINTLTPLP